MRKILILTTLAILLIGCTSKEDKANKLIKDEMFKTLYDFESYEPIETKIDSAYNSIYIDKEALSLAYEAHKYLKEVNKCMDKSKEARRTMEIWMDSYSYTGKTKYNQAKDEANSNIDKAKEYLAKIDELCAKIKERNSNIDNNFIGWKATHKFRCKNKGGNFDLGNYMYVFDSKIKNITYKEDLDDEDTILIKGLISEALEPTEETD